jgi:predicted SAM-dependent methyltransferase
VPSSTQRNNPILERIQRCIDAVFHKYLWHRQQHLPQGMRRAAMEFLHEQRIEQICEREAPKFASLRDRKELKVHLGCGSDIRPGWVNIDLRLWDAPHLSHQPSGAICLNYDLRRVLPLSDASCGLIYSSHFFEHLEYDDGVRLMKDCYRVLRAGGVFRAALPDFRSVFEAFLRNDAAYFDLIDIKERYPNINPAARCMTDYLDWAIYQWGQHKCIYDAERVGLVLRSTGFRDARQVLFDNHVDVDTPLRRKYSFYVEAMK